MTSFADSLKLYGFDAPKQAGIYVGNGNNRITIVGGNDNVIQAGDGDNIITTSSDDASILVGDGDNDINVMGDNANIQAGNGDNEVNLDGDNGKIKVGDGDNKLIADGDNNSLMAGDGNNTVAFKGDNSYFIAGDGDNKVAFWGKNVGVAVGDGNNNIVTLDWANGGPIGNNETATSIVGSMASGHSLDWLQDTEIQDLAVGARSYYNYNETKVKEFLRTWYENDRYLAGYKCLKEIDMHGIYRSISTKTHETIGLDQNNVSFHFGNGNNSILTTFNGYRTEIDYSNGSMYWHYQDIADKDNLPPGFYEEFISSLRYKSPLVVDYNQDGKVSAKAGKGVDLNNDGKADGCASDGDKMLAMSDINGNQEIDGAEVFGDQTVDPFTGKKLNAKNGFEALELVAKSAEKHTGMSVIDNEGNVDLAKLQTALKTVGISLGFISDANNEMLEKLDKVASINVKNYTEQDDNSKDVQHRQLGSYTDITGKQYKVDDVWFAV